MEPKAAAEHLQVIRTLMERSALYRRTLVPLMIYVGSVGTVASVAGILLGIGPRAFHAWWFGAAVLAVVGALVIARWQAQADREAFWSPPTLRVAQAIAPPLAAGLLFTLAFLVSEPVPAPRLFVFVSALFYGAAAHAAGFFMPRGMKLFGWLVIVVALVGYALVFVADPRGAAIRLDHLLMGIVFGVLHLVYGAYLRVTEPAKMAA
ncbi:MAG: hypothetical protein ACM3NQ_19165 [Bacteroidales bacterium]